jgi:hypothetical protein
MSAIISTCGQYRYRLDRDLGRSGPIVAIIGVNSSTADAVINDATIRKDIGFGHRLGWSRIIKGNKFAFRATNVKTLRLIADPVGPDNDGYLTNIMREADIVIAAWGPLTKLPKPLRGRWLEVVGIADRIGHKLKCWGTAMDGHPRHPLMLSYNVPLIDWKMP